MIDATQLPGGPSLVLGVLLYASASFLAAPHISEREIARDGLLLHCEAEIEAVAARSAKPKKVIPRSDCASVLQRSPLGLFLSPYDQGQLCREVGDFDLSFGANDALRRAEALRQQQEADRIARATAESETRCSCAADVYQQHNRVALAVYAGTGRLYTPPAVSNRVAELGAAVEAPICASKVGG